MTTIQNATLTLIPVEINQMISDMKLAVASYSSELQGAIAPITSYIAESGLDGKAYLNSKHHMEDHVLVIRAAIIANSKLESCLENLSTIIGSERLVEDELLAHIKRCEEKISDYDDQIRFYQDMLRNDTYEMLFGWHARYRINCCENLKESLTKTVDALNGKIELLYQINAESATCFDSIASAYANVKLGIQSLNSGRGIKEFKPRDNSNWRTDINKAVVEKDVDEIIIQLREKYPELTESELLKIREELKKELLTKACQQAIEKTGSLAEPLFVSVGQILIKIGSVPGPTGENTFILLNRTGIFGSKVLSYAPKIGRGIAATSKVVPIIGAAVDFGLQIHSGESKTNALIKSGAHLGISLGAAKFGAVVGSAIFPGAGTVVGAAVGFMIAALVNTGFDAVYDEKVGDKIDIEVDKLLNSVNVSFSSVGNASSGNLGGLNNVMFA